MQYEQLCRGTVACVIGALDGNCADSAAVAATVEAAVTQMTPTLKKLGANRSHVLAVRYTDSPCMRLAPIPVCDGAHI